MNVFQHAQLFEKELFEYLLRRSKLPQRKTIETMAMAAQETMVIELKP